MATNSTVSASRRKSATTSPWEKPYPDFPLSYHPPSGRLYKKIRGKRHYFGYADNWQAAVEKYLKQKDDLYAGRKPRETGDGLTMRELCNRFLTSKQLLLDNREITNRTFLDYKSVTDRVITQFGRSRLVEDLAADDFESLRTEIAKRRGPVALGNEIQRVRVVFNYAYKQGLIDRPIRFGETFRKPAKRVLRRERAKNGSKMFEPQAIRDILQAAPPQLRAMILLGVNSGFGNADCGTMPLPALDLDSGWINYPRPKTGIDRRCPLWSETVDALRAAVAGRPHPKDETNAELVFVTKYGESWHKETSANPISHEFRKLIKSIDAKRASEAKKKRKKPPEPLYRKGVGFYSFRHVFETIAGESRDQVAVNYIMGHVDDSMAAVYRERISDERLRAVTDYVHEWLFGKADRDC